MLGQPISEHEMSLRRNVASHSRVLHMPISRMTGSELRAAQKGKEVRPSTETRRAAAALMCAEALPIVSDGIGNPSQIMDAIASLGLRLAQLESRLADVQPQGRAFDGRFTLHPDCDPSISPDLVECDVRQPLEPRAGDLSMQLSEHGPALPRRRSVTTPAQRGNMQHMAQRLPVS